MGNTVCIIMYMCGYRPTRNAVVDFLVQQRVQNLQPSQNRCSFTGKFTFRSANIAGAQWPTIHGAFWSFCYVCFRRKKEMKKSVSSTDQLWIAIWHGLFSPFCFRFKWRMADNKGFTAVKTPKLVRNKSESSKTSLPWSGTAQIEVSQLCFLGASGEQLPDSWSGLSGLKGKRLHKDQQRAQNKTQSTYTILYNFVSWSQARAQRPFH